MNEDIQDIQEQQESVSEPEINDVIPEDEPVSEIEDTTEPEVAIQDGEVKFSDDFFDEIPDDKPLQQENIKTPNYYTDEEIQNIPANQWDKSRMPDDVRKYYEAFVKQQEARTRQQEIQKRAETPPSFLEQPKRFTPKELHEEAMKLAVQNLGLKSADDFDTYEGEHLAALDMARQEILQKNAAETANYQRKANEYQNWQMFSGQLAAQPDFNEFHQWYLDEIKKNGNTPEQIDAGLKNLANLQGFGAVQNVWSEFYRQFQNSKTQAQNRPVQRTRAKTPPILESTQGGNSGNKRSYNMREFGNLDEDAQVQALMDMGIV